ncbi:Nif3-like dinuclear metal center hexameric protein [Desulfurobacterium sp.]
MASFGDIVAFLKTLVPEDWQDSWDNSGVQIGLDKDVRKVLFALSISDAVVKEAVDNGVDAVVTHHPVTISSIKFVDERSVPGRFFVALIREGISVYSMHTNLDVSPFGPTSIIAETLGVRNARPVVSTPGAPPYGLAGEIEPVTQRELVKKLCSFLPRDIRRVVNYKPDRIVRKVSICSGSGGSLVKEASALSEFYITGDVKYHDAELAVALGLTVFDAGHFGTEKLFAEKILGVLKERFPEITFLHARSEKSPFEVPDECVNRS